MIKIKKSILQLALTREQILEILLLIKNKKPIEFYKDELQYLINTLDAEKAINLNPLYKRILKYAVENNVVKTYSLTSIFLAERNLLQDEIKKYIYRNGYLGYLISALLNMNIPYNLVYNYIKNFNILIDIKDFLYIMKLKLFLNVFKFFAEYFPDKFTKKFFYEMKKDRSIEDYKYDWIQKAAPNINNPLSNVTYLNDIKDLIYANASNLLLIKSIKNTNKVSTSLLNMMYKKLYVKVLIYIKKNVNLIKLDKSKLCKGVKLLFEL